MRIAREEIFGPVLSVLTFRTPDEAIAKANNTPYGLSAGVWTEKGSRMLGMAAALRAGVVWANTFNRFDPTARSAAWNPASAGRAAARAWPPTSPPDDRFERPITTLATACGVPPRGDHRPPDRPRDQRRLAEHHLLREAAPGSANPRR